MTMARIAGISTQDAEQEIALAYQYARQGLAQLREHFDDAQLVELTHFIALENMRGRFNLALGIGAAGFTEGMVCAVPEATSQPVLATLAALTPPSPEQPSAQHTARIVQGMRAALDSRSSLVPYPSCHSFLGHTNYLSLYPNRPRAAIQAATTWR
jgi:hypothetical protein